MGSPQVDNDKIADTLEEVGDLLEHADANPFRVRSYRRAADTIRNSDRSMAGILEEEGKQGLEDLENIGETLARAIEEILQTGRLRQLERLRAEISPEAMLATVPGVGETLARRIANELNIDSLEDLEMAAHDGRLAEVEGMGESRLQGVRNALASRLNRSTRRRSHQRKSREAPGSQPSVEILLDVDAEYRRKAEEGKLETIAPRRFNPEGQAWLPIMESERNGWKFTALFSNTSRAHELDKTHDWVVIYYEKKGREDQCTVVTGTRGSLKGKRVVRGREEECRQHDRSQEN